MNETVIEDYLDLLSAEREAPFIPYLRELTRRHLERFPFENVSKLYYYHRLGREGLAWLADAGTFLRNCREFGFGGNCYLLNAHYGALLRALGFDVEHVAATGGNLHLANRVTIDRRAYYVDVGYGAPLFEPLALEEEPAFSRCGEEVQVTKAGERRFRIDRKANGTSFVVKTIEWEARTLASFADGITHSLRDEADNPFMRRIVATRFADGVAFGAIDAKLFVKRESGTEVHEYVAKEEWLDMMRTTFGFAEGPLREALKFVAERGNAVFPA